MDDVQKFLNWTEWFECSITINPEASSYQTIGQYVQERRALDDRCFEDVDPEVLAKCINDNVMVVIQVYPHNGIGSYEVFHYDVLEAIKLMNACLDTEQ